MTSRCLKHVPVSVFSRGGGFRVLVQGQVRLCGSISKQQEFLRRFLDVVGLQDPESFLWFYISGIWRCCAQVHTRARNIWCLLGRWNLVFGPFSGTKQVAKIWNRQTYCLSWGQGSFLIWTRSEHISLRYAVSSKPKAHDSIASIFDFLDNNQRLLYQAYMISVAVVVNIDCLEEYPSSQVVEVQVVSFSFTYCSASHDRLG